MSDKLKRHASAAEDSAYEQDVAEQPVPALLSNRAQPPKRPISWLKNLTVLGRASLLMAVEIVRLLRFSLPKHALLFPGHQCAVVGCHFDYFLAASRKEERRFPGTSGMDTGFTTCAR